MGITRLVQGVSDKRGKLLEVCAAMGIMPEQCAYIGDDLSDLPCMALCGVSAAPADAMAQVCGLATLVCQREDGRGAVREFIDWLGRRQEDENLSRCG